MTNKMSISNLIVVLGPNLLWESDTLKTVSLEHVCRFPFILFLWPALVIVQFCILLRSLIEVWSSRHFLRTRFLFASVHLIIFAFVHLIICEGHKVIRKTFSDEGNRLLSTGRERWVDVITLPTASNREQKSEFKG